MTTVAASAAEAPAHERLQCRPAYEMVRDRLVMLDIRPGEPIDDDRLADELGFGRTPVREALKRLERERLVVAFPRRGTFATAVDMTDLGGHLRNPQATRAHRGGARGPDGVRRMCERG